MDDVIKDLYSITNRVDDIFKEVVNGNKDVLDKLDSVLYDFSKYSLEDFKDNKLIPYIMHSISTKVNLIYVLLNGDVLISTSMEELTRDFKVLELKRFNIVNNYVMGIVTVSELKAFEKDIMDFRKRLYVIPISDSNILDVAKMKSKIQHFITEVLEDQEVLDCAYGNSI